MEVKLILGIVSSLLIIPQAVPYIRDILRRKTEPHIYSWFIWGTLQMIAALSQLKGGAGYGSWALIAGGIFCYTVCILSFRFGTKNITLFDRFCFVASLLSIGVYLFLENPLWAILFVTCIDLLAFLPTFRKGYQEPYTETASTFAISALANVLSILALQVYSTTTVLYMAVLFATNTIFTVMLLVRRKYMVPRSGIEPLLTA